MDTMFTFAVGLGLSAASGFRAFVPMLVMSLAARGGHLTLAPGMEWVASDAALAVLTTATVAEILAYYVPWLDNLLDTIATPTAIIAGTLMTASVLTDLSPLLRWAIAVIIGGGTAGIVQGSTVALRLASSTMTGGLGNPILATAELLGAITVAALAILAPIIALAIVIVLVFLALRKAGRHWRRRRATAS
ncbi:MAG: DUF4126 domain-containing protein [Armatimonadota bacterium]